MKRFLLILLAAPTLFACHRSRTTRQEDQLYSRHLQRRVQLTILHTPVPSDKSTLNLLLLNDGQELDAFRVQPVIDSLYRLGKLKPLLVVGIQAGDRMQEYGVAGKPDYQGRGSRAGFYDAFVNDELYPYIKKKAGVRKFQSVVIAGCSLGGLSAFDIAWNHADKIDKVGVFSGSFWWRDKDAQDSSYSDDKDRILLARIRASRKKPQLQYWFSVGTAEEKSDRDGDGVIDAVDDTRDLVNLLRQKNLPGSGSIRYKEVAGAGHDWIYWQQQLPDFLLWAFGK